MVVKSRIGQGLQRRGNTKIDSNILIEKTGPMQITVRAGTYTDVLGVDYELKNDKVINLEAGTNNFVALIYNPTTGELDVWHATDPTAEPPVGFKLLQVLIGWGWFVIPPGTTDIAGVPLHCSTWIDNVGFRYKKLRDPETFKVIEKPVFYGKGEETGKEYEFEEIEHFAVRRDEGKGIYFLCPSCGAVSRGKPCKKCGNKDCVKIKESTVVP